MALGGENIRNRKSAAARMRSAIESTRTIANLTLSTPAEADLEAVVNVLRSGALPVAKVADALGWTTPRVVDALAGGGNAGILTFSKDNDTTIVSLAAK